jgi:energy-coupling factor transporter ATP-binding protein EcfA2
MISLKKVTYIYPGTSSPALKDVTLEIPAGQFCAVVGRNGAGKSTLAYTIAGFIPHFYHGTLQGEVSVAGKSTQSTPIHEQVTSVGLVFQNPFNQISGTKFTVREEIAFGMENLGMEREEMVARCEEMMTLVGISDLGDRFPLSLSGGQMQRVVIASILAMHPQILVLDEPTSQLDPIGSREVLAAIRQLATRHQITVLIVEHKLEWLAAFADRMVAMAEGSIIADGSPRDVLSDEAVWERGVGLTRYTLAARQALMKGFWPAGLKLPVTLDEAIQAFQVIKK